jgi:hypothetical protein
LPHHIVSGELHGSPDRSSEVTGRAGPQNSHHMPS